MPPPPVPHPAGPLPGLGLAALTWEVGTALLIGREGEEVGTIRIPPGFGGPESTPSTGEDSVRMTKSLVASPAGPYRDPNPRK